LVIPFTGGLFWQFVGASGPLCQKFGDGNKTTCVYQLVRISSKNRRNKHNFSHKSDSRVYVKLSGKKLVLSSYLEIQEIQANLQKLDIVLSPQLHKCICQRCGSNTQATVNKVKSKP
jgi:hypothetical protein